MGALDIVFGLMNENNDNVIHILNYCILFAKKFINTCRKNIQACTFQIFLCKLKQKLIIKEYIAEINDCIADFRVKWNTINYNVLN